MQPAPPATILPVFVFPNAVNFYLEDQETHKQVLTIYNVYDTAVRFRVLCTAPNKYNVVDSEGSIKPHCSLDIVIRHKDLRASNCNITDKFRIQFLEYSTKKVIAKRDILVTLNSGVPEKSSEKTKERSWEYEKSLVELKTIRETTDPRGRGKSGPNSFVVFVGVVCIAGLLMPNEGEETSFRIQLSCHLKLVLAYVLGLVTMVVLQS